MEIINKSIGENKPLRQRISKKTGIIILILLLIIALTVWFFTVRNNNEIVLTAEVETTVYPHIAEVTGKLLEVPAELGQTVKKGDILAVIDSTNQEYALEQLELTLVQMQMTLLNLKKGADDEQIKQAGNSVSAAKAAFEKASSDFNNIEKLYKEGAASKNELDNAKYLLDVARANLDSADQQLRILISGADEESVLSAEAGVRLIESQIEQMKETLEKYNIKAAVDGTVMSKNYTVGDIVSQGYNLIDLAARDEMYLVSYIPEESVHLIEYGQEIVFSANGNKYKGELCYIDLKSQYTPKDMQSAANKNKDSIKIKVSIGPDVPLKPGQKTEIVIYKIKD